MFADFDDDEFEVRQRRRETRRGHKRGGRQRPVGTSRETSSKDAHVVGEVGDGERLLTQIVERRRGVKRRQNPSLAFGDQP